MKPKSNPFLSPFGPVSLAIPIALSLAGPAAYGIDSNGTDAAGTSSFNSGTRWVGGVAPTPGNPYRILNTHLLRTPTNATAIPFQGDSLEILTGGTLRDKTANTVTINNLIMSGGTFELTQPNNVNTIVAAGTLAGAITLTGSTTSTFHAGINTDVAGQTLTISSAISGSGSIRTAGSNGRIILTADNSFSGGVTLDGLANSKLQLGNANAAKNSIVTISLTDGLAFGVGLGGTFHLNGLAGASNQVLADTAAAAVTLSIGGNHGTSSYSGNLSGGGNLTKVGNGTFTLAGPNNAYTGTTAVNGGQLAISGSLVSPSGGAVAVNSGGKLNVTGTGTVGAVNVISVNGGGVLTGTSVGINGPVTLAGGTADPARGAIDLTDGVFASLALNNTLTLGGALAGDSSKLVFEARLEGEHDQLLLGLNPVTVNEGGVAITIVNLGVEANKSYPLVSFTGGNGTGYVNDPVNHGFTLANPNLAFGITGALVVTDSGVSLQTAGATAPGTAYWSGNKGSEWDDTAGNFGNFTTDAAGTTFVGTYPIATSHAIFAGSGASNLANTLGRDFSIHSLSFTNGTGGVSIGGSNTLTLGPGGIALAASNGGAALSMTTLALDDSQSWSNASNQNLTVSANVTGDAEVTVNNTATGVTILSGVNTYSVGTILEAGVLRLSGSGTLGANTAALTLNGGRLELNGTQPVVGDTNADSDVTIVNNGAANSILTIGNGGSSNTIIAGLLTDTNNSSTGTLGLVKAGTGVTELASLNTYTGPTKLSGGTLQIATLADGGVASGIGQSGSDSTNWVFDGGTLGYTGPTTTTNRSFSILAGKTGGLQTSNDLTLTGSTPATTGGFTKTGPGKLILPGSHAYSGTTIVNGGILELTGTLNSAGAEGTGALAVGDVFGEEASLHMDGGTIHLGANGPAAGTSGSIGRVVGSSGSVTMTGGQITVNSGVIKQNFSTGLLGYGALTMSGGSISLAGNFGAGTTGGGIGVQNISGGSITVSNGYAGILGNGANGIAVANYSGNAIFTAASPVVQPGAFVGMVVGEGGAGILNVSGNATLTLGGNADSAGLDIGRNNAASASGVVNLGAVVAGGGTIVTNAVRHSGAAGTGVFNFHGGTLRAATFANPAFMTGLSNAYVFNEGAMIDTNSATVSIVQPLQAPVGIGITGIALTAQGTGYLNAPVVTVTGGTLAATGAVATAVANFNPATGEVTGITLTNPGCYLSTAGVAVNFLGGGKAPVAPVVGPLATAPNTSGGLTKAGTGTLTLAGVDTYTGATTVTGGTLSITGSIASPVTVNSGAVLAGTGTIGGTVTTVGATSIIAPGASSIGTLSAGSTSVQGVLAVELNATAGDQLNVMGNLSIDPAASLTVSATSPTAPKYVIAKYTGTLTGAFPTPILPTGYSLEHDTAAKEIALVKEGFEAFMATFTVPEGEAGPEADPDDDGIKNVIEYALEGFDPTVPNAAPGTVSDSVLSFTKRALAVSNGDLIYQIEDSTTLGDLSDPWTVVVNHPAGNTDAAIGFSLLPGSPKNFARLVVIQTSP